MKRRLLYSIHAFLACCVIAHAAADSITPDLEPKTADDLIAEFAGVEYFWQQIDIAWELIALGDPAVIPKMEAYLDTEDRAERSNAALVLAGLGDERGLAILIGELEDTGTRPTDRIRSDGKPYPEGQIRQDRYYAAHLLGQLGNKEAVPALIRATQDAEINLRAAISLGEIGDRSAIPALRKMAKDFPEQRIWAGYGLAALDEQEGFYILAEVITSDAHWTNRRHAVEALGEFGDSKDLSALLKALKDEHPNVRVSAARALGEIGDPAAMPALVEALKDTEVTKANGTMAVNKEARMAIEAIKARGR